MFLNATLLITLINITSCKKEITVPDTIISASDITVQAVTQTKPALLSQTDLFDAALTTRGNLSAYQQLSGDPYTAMVINPGCVSVVNDPVYGSKRKVIEMNVRTQDNAGLTANPRAQVQTPMKYVEGQEVYVGFSVRFKATFWTYFLTFAEFYGAPYVGSSPFRLGIQESNLVAASEVASKQTNLWKEPMQANVWYDFVYREILSKDAKKGLVEVWLRKQGESAYTIAVPATNIPTITAANLLGPNYHKLACYYDKTHTFTDASKKTRVSGISMYVTNHKIGKSFSAVAPVSIR